MRKRFLPGVSFGDFVIQDSSTRKSRVPDEKEVDYRKGWLVWMGVIVLFGGIVFRLAYLQLFYGKRYRLLSDQNRVLMIKLPAPRGIIYDRDGGKLAENKKVMEETTIGGTTDVTEKWRRLYPFGAEGAHVVGYLGEVKEDEVGLLKSAGRKYDPGEEIGRSGLEALLEEKLRGVDGGRLVEVDYSGKIVRELGRREPVSGQDIKTTIDVRLQKAALLALEGKKGAVVAIRPGTGEVLAMVSSPSFDPNLFHAGKSKAEEVAKILTDKDLPMFNRSIGAVYPPGSTFKMVTTAAAISDGKVPATFTYNDTGIIKVGDFSYSTWLFTKGGGTEGTIGFSRAITRSTDTFFYKVGEMTTPEIMAKWANEFGMGNLSGIDLPGEVAGLIPTPDWKRKTKGEQWFLGNTYHMAIGQGDVLATPLQVAVMTAALANNGQRCRPHVVADSSPECHEVKISTEAKRIISEGMKGACSPGGTAFPLFDWNTAAANRSSSAAYASATATDILPMLACKTGTAEYVADDGKTKSHGWLTAYAPAGDPTIAITAVVEGGGEGSNVAAPIVRKVLSVYFGVEDRYNYAAIPQEKSE